MSNIRRVCLFGGPGLGKSTISAWLFAMLKMEKYSVEHVAEYVKAWAWIGRPPTSFDQVYIFGKQLHKEDIVLRNGRSAIITESPLFLSIFYGRKYKAHAYSHLAEIAKEFDYHYPARNILIDRGDLTYQSDGRFQTEEEAKELDGLFMEAMNDFGLKYETLRYDALDSFLALSKSDLAWCQRKDEERNRA